LNINDLKADENSFFSKKELEVDSLYPTKISKYYLSLIDKNNIKDDPIAKQCLPHINELENTTFDSFDPLFEEKQKPVSKLIHRYKDRVVLLATSKCNVHCRFCFRKRQWKTGSIISDITEKELAHIADYLTIHTEVQEVLISGGDPLTLSIAKLQIILNKLEEIPNIEVIRLCTRMPVTDPKNITAQLADMLSQFNGLWIATHFNHPNEITSKSMNACQQFIQRGIPVVNQTVLLKSINDNSEILETLFRELIKNRIKPHYLFHIDPVKSVKHFSTGIDTGLNILRELRKNLSSLAIPTFAIDLPEGGGKVPLQPNYKKNNKFETLNNDFVEYY